MKLQTFALLLPLSLPLIALTIIGNEKISLYKVKLKASDISGTNLFREPTDLYYTAIQPNLTAIKREDVINLVGSYRPDYSSSETLSLFDLSAQNASYKLLDEIDMDYYSKVSFPELADSTKYKEEFSRFKIEFSNATTIADKKNVIIAHPVIQKDLIKSRLLVIPRQVTFDRHRIANLTESMKAEVTGLQVNGVDISPKIRQYLSKLVDESVKVSGVYYTSRFRREYIGYIKDHIDTTPVSEYGSDMFSRNLLYYLDPSHPRVAINTQLAAIQLKGSLVKALVTTDTIAAVLHTKFNLPVDKAHSIAASASFAFNSKVTQNIATNFNNTYLIRYSTSQIADELAIKKEIAK